jgi:hypothetical protein
MPRKKNLHPAEGTYRSNPSLLKPSPCDWVMIRIERETYRDLTLRADARGYPTTDYLRMLLKKIIADNPILPEYYLDDE